MQHTPLPNYLRTHRRRAGLLQRDVAYLLGGVSPITVSRHERGLRTPDVDTALAYETLYGTSVRKLFAGRAQTVDSVIRQRAAVLAKRLGGAGDSRTAALLSSVAHSHHATSNQDHRD